MPPPAHLVMDLMGDLEQFLHSPDPGIPPLLRAGYAHVQFETIHPFADGNGRIGRILITMILLAAQVLDEPLLYLSLYFKQHRRDYYDLLNSVRLTGSWHDWMGVLPVGSARDGARGNGHGGASAQDVRVGPPNGATARQAHGLGAESARGVYEAPVVDGGGGGKDGEHDVPDSKVRRCRR